MNTIPLEKKDKETLKQWLKGHLVRDEKGSVMNHRIWFKNIFNPFLRSMGWVIVSKVGDKDNITGYEIRKYPFNKI